MSKEIKPSPEYVFEAKPKKADLEENNEPPWGEFLNTKRKHNPKRNENKYISECIDEEILI